MDNISLMICLITIEIFFFPPFFITNVGIFQKQILKVKNSQILTRKRRAY